MPYTMVCRDITTMEVDAIVNAANTDLTMEGEVSHAVFRSGGLEQIKSACETVAPVPVGGAVITPAFDLPSKYIIHAVGPVYEQRSSGACEGLLRSAYLQSLDLAAENQCSSIAFPLISSGACGYPGAEALEIATKAISEFLAEHEMDIYLAVLTRWAIDIDKEQMAQVQRYLDEEYEPPFPENRGRRGFSGIFKKHRALEEQVTDVQEEALMMPPDMEAPGDSFLNELPADIDDWVDDLDEPFNTVLFRLIDASGKTDAEVYKKANIDRKLFSKIRRREYLPGKRTILSLAIALELPLKETCDLLERAGYALSHSQKFDVIIEYFIINNKYDIHEINQVLFRYDQPLLGSRG